MAVIYTGERKEELLWEIFDAIANYKLTKRRQQLSSDWLISMRIVFRSVILKLQRFVNSFYFFTW